MRDCCAIAQPSPLPHHKLWHPPNVTTRRICAGEIFFARACAIEAQLTTRCDRAPATRRRTMDVRAKNISPLRTSTVAHRDGTAPAVRRRIIDLWAKNISPLRNPQISTIVRAPFVAHCDRTAPAVRHRIIDLRAKNISPLRHPQISTMVRAPFVAHRDHARLLPSHHVFTGEKYFAPTSSANINRCPRQCPSCIANVGAKYFSPGLWPKVPHQSGASSRRDCDGVICRRAIPWQRRHG